ncbi:MAG: hypothetical protein M3Z66_06260 [Chloroflexota bacterium]|nr:hypothetical protein [Chloroflexota bacterium]
MTTQCALHDRDHQDHPRPGCRSFGEVGAQLERWIADRRPPNTTRATTIERGLARWVARHRLRYRLGSLSPDAALSTILGWTWQVRRPHRQVVGCRCDRAPSPSNDQLGG